MIIINFVSTCELCAYATHLCILALHAGDIIILLDHNDNSYNSTANYYSASVVESKTAYRATVLFMLKSWLDLTGSGEINGVNPADQNTRFPLRSESTLPHIVSWISWVNDTR